LIISSLPIGLPLMAVKVPGKTVLYKALQKCELHDKALQKSRPHALLRRETEAAVYTKSGVRHV
jgi:hypothetical protein